MILALGRYDSPIGQLTVATVGDCIVGIDLRGDPAALETHLIKKTGASASGSPSRVVLDGLDRYFAGDLTAIDALAVNPSGTPFQLRVWRTLRDVRAGSTTSYSAIAKRLGMPQAVRAVGAANGANPIPIVIPCHRVIGADGRLVGYGGGLERKRWLLAHEGVRSGTLL